MSWLNIFEKDPRKDYLSKMCRHAHESANTLRKNWDLQDEQWLAILFEFLYFFFEFDR